MELRRGLVAIFAVACAFGGQSASAWGPEGHHTVGAIADKLIAGRNAATQVHVLLGALSLQEAAVWADCAKGVDPSKDYAYTSAGVYPECKIYETPELEAEMIDFVRRNDTNCTRKATEESCHKQYHYSDVAIQRTEYSSGAVGARSDDIVAAVAATIHVLRGETAPPPFSIKDKREALLLLAHYAGDIHQPLHVGAVYLDRAGSRVDPDVGTFDPTTATRGGNQIATVVASTEKHGANLHATWDNIPASLMTPRIGSRWLARARAVPITGGSTIDWSRTWGTESLREATLAFEELQFAPLPDTSWSTTLSSSYVKKMTAIKTKQLTKAGARLAQILSALWP